MEYDMIEVLKILDGFINEFVYAKRKSDKRKAQEILEFLRQVSEDKIKKIETPCGSVSIELNEGELIDINTRGGEYVVDIIKKDGSELSSFGNPFLKGYAKYLFLAVGKTLNEELPIGDNFWKDFLKNLEKTNGGN